MKDIMQDARERLLTHVGRGKAGGLTLSLYTDDLIDEGDAEVIITALSDLLVGKEWPTREEVGEH